MDKELYFGLKIFLYLNKENQNTSKDDFPCLLLPGMPEEEIRP